MVYNTCAFVLAFVRMWLINIRFHISQSKEGGGDKLSLSAIIKSNLYLSGPANGLNYFVLTFEVLFYGLGKLALNDDNSLSRKLFTSAMRYAIQTFKLHLFGREKTIF